MSTMVSLWCRDTFAEDGGKEFPHSIVPDSAEQNKNKFWDVKETSFPELLPLTKLFYHKANTVHHKWDDRTWRTLLMKEGASQGCPFSPLFASFVVARLLDEQQHD